MKTKTKESDILNHDKRHNKIIMGCYCIHIYIIGDWGEHEILTK